MVARRRDFKPTTFASSSPHFSRIGFWAMGLLFLFTIATVCALHVFWFSHHLESATSSSSSLSSSPAWVVPAKLVKAASGEAARRRRRRRPSAFEPFSNTSLAYAMINPSTTTSHHLLLLPAASAGDDVENDDDGPVDRRSGLHVITTFFRGMYSVARLREILASLVSNLENPFISAVHVLWEDEDPRTFIPPAVQALLPNFRHKLVLTRVQHQPTYKEMFSYANTELERGAIAMVTNADIYFDSSVKCINTTAGQRGDGGEEEPRMAFALSRRHSPHCGNKTEHFHLFDLCIEFTQSHDSFVFAPPLPQQVLDTTEHTQNAGFGAENIVIFELKRANFTIRNPCFQIKGYHYHCVDERHYDRSVIISKVDKANKRHARTWPAIRQTNCNQMWVY